MARGERQSKGPETRDGNDSQSIIVTQRVQSMILLVRGQNVILDSDLAQLYGVPTKRLNEQVRRNMQRFPSDFMLQLTDQEKVEVVADCDHLQRQYKTTTNRSSPLWMPFSC